VILYAIIVDFSLFVQSKMSQGPKNLFRPILPLAGLFGIAGVALLEGYLLLLFVL